MLGIWWFIESLCEMKVGAALSVNAEKFGSFTAQLFSLNVVSEVLMLLMLQNIFSLMHECNFQYNGLLTNSVFSDDPPFFSI